MDQGTERGAELVVFRLGIAEYALEVGHVGQVVPMVALTPVPEAPPWIAGMLNLHGRVVPVLDLRVRLGLTRKEPDLRTPIVIVRGGDGAAGIVVDTVDEVLSLPRTSLSPPSELLRSTGPVGAVATTGDRMIQVLDAQRLIAGTERFVPAEV